jgi:hypothetical protein
MPSTSIAIRKRQLPWVGTGTSGSWDNVSEALYYGGLDYAVTQSDAYDRYGNKLPGLIVNHNANTGEIMGITSDQYGVVQNASAFSLLDPFCLAGGIIEHAGMTINGMCFMVMRVPSMAFGFHGDDFELYVCAMNSFNTKFPLAIIITPVRVYCQNMFRKLMKRGDTVLMIKHGRFAADRIMSASKASSLLLDYKDDFTSEMESDYYKPSIGVYDFVEEMMPLVPVDSKHPRAEKSNEKIKERRRYFVDQYYYAPDNKKYEGTKLGLINAYYDWITHHVPMRATANFSDIRLSNMISGSAVDRKLIELA